MSEEFDDDVVFDVSRLNDPEEGMRAIRYLRQYQKKKNQILLSEFNEYEMLFKLDGRKTIGAEKYTELFISWSTRISLYEPVYILDDFTHEVIQTLPPMFARADTINKCEFGGDIVSGVLNTANQPNVVTDKASAFVGYLRQIFADSQDKEKKKRIQEEANRLAEEAVKKPIAPIQQSTTQEKPPQQPSPKKLDIGIENDVEYL